MFYKQLQYETKRDDILDSLIADITLNHAYRCITSLCVYMWYTLIFTLYCTAVHEVLYMSGAVQYVQGCLYACLKGRHHLNNGRVVSLNLI